MNDQPAPSRRLFRFVALAGVAAVVGALSGCSTAVERRAAAPYVGSEGASWSVVLPSPALADEHYLAVSELHGEYARLDGRLGVGSVTTGYPFDTWPDEGYPTLDRTRRITIGTRPDSVTYFQPARRASDRGASDWGAPLSRPLPN
jgi:hypothetical protein